MGMGMFILEVHFAVAAIVTPSPENERGLS